MRFIPKLIVISAILLQPFVGCKKQDDKSPQQIQKEARSGLPEKIELPEQAVGYVLDTNPIDFMTKAEKLAGNVAPVPPGAMNMSLVMGLQKIGLKDTRVIDLKAPAGFIITGREQKHAIVVACRITSKDKLLESLSPVWKVKKEQNGVVELIREEIDTYEVFKGKKAQPAKSTTSLFVKFANKNVFASYDRLALEKNQPFLLKILASSTSPTGISGTVMINRLRNQYAELLIAFPGLVDQIFKHNSALTASIPNIDKFQWFISWFGIKCLSAVNQTERVSFALGLDENAADITFGYYAEKGSFLEKFLMSQKATKLTLAQTLPKDHFIANGMNIQWDLLKSDFMPFFKEMLNECFGITASKELIDAFTEMIEITGDEVAVSESFTSNGLELVEVFAIKDIDRYEKLLEKIMPLTTDLVNQLGIGFSIKTDKNELLKEIGQHDGIKLRAFDFDLDASSMPEMQAQMMKNMYGDKMHFVIALFDQRLALSFGKHAEKTIKELIDRTRKKGQGLYEDKSFQHAAGDWIQAPGGYFLYMSFSRMISMGMQTTLGMLGDKSAAENPPVSKSGLFLYAKSKPDHFTINLRIPALHLEEIGDLIKKMTSVSK